MFASSSSGEASEGGDSLLERVLRPFRQPVHSRACCWAPLGSEKRLARRTNSCCSPEPAAAAGSLFEIPRPSPDSPNQTFWARSSEALVSARLAGESGARY